MSIFSRRSSRQEAEIARLEKQVTSWMEQNTRLAHEKEQLVERNTQLVTECNAFLELLRRLEKKMVRFDRGGQTFYDEAQALLKRYDEPLISQ